MLKKTAIYIFFLAILTSMAGCSMERSSLEQSEQKKPVYKIKQQEYDFSDAVSLFLNKKIQDTLKSGAEQEEDYYSYDGEDQSLVGGAYGDGKGFYIEYYDYTDNAGMAYMWALDNYEHRIDVVDWGIRKEYPEEELDSCSKEEVLEYCRPYAALMGYNNADITVCAMTTEVLEDERKNFFCGPPVEGDKKETGSGGSVVHASKPWTKEHEAYYIVYKPYVEGVLMDTTHQTFELIYVPKYKKIVWASGCTPWLIEDNVGEESTITAESAIQFVKKSYGGKEDDIVIENTSIVYSLNWDFNKEYKAFPCWRVDYEIKKSAQYQGNQAFKSKLVNAVTGEFCTAAKED